MDSWPEAVNDTLGSLTAGTLSFNANTLLENDHGNGLWLVRVGPMSSAGGTVTGTAFNKHLRLERNKLRNRFG